LIRRWTHLLILCSAVAPPAAYGQRDVLDPAFEKIPFDQWLSERGPASFRCTVTADKPELSFHQRLVISVAVSLDGRDLELRRGKGELVFFTQITAPGDRRYQVHGVVKLADLDPHIKSANLEWRQPAFVVPGEYRLAVAVLDTATGDHVARVSQFRVPPPQRKQLTEMWRELPDVEFIASEHPPESWFLPEIKQRLRWLNEIDPDVRFTVFMNIAPPPPADGRPRRPDSSAMAALLPALKLLSAPGMPSISERVEVIDIARRRVAFRREGGSELDWSQLKAGLQESNTASIDVGSLSERHRNAQFFVSEVRKAVRASGKGCVVVVLTAPVSFEGKEDLQPISLEDLPACRVLYVRVHSIARITSLGGPTGPNGRGRRGMGSLGRDPTMRLPVSSMDELEGTLKPLKPKVFDIDAPDQMSRVVEEIQRALAAPR
jgi:hypothetical protein